MPGLHLWSAYAQGAHMPRAYGALTSGSVLRTTTSPPSEVAGSAWKQWPDGESGRCGDRRTTRPCRNTYAANPAFTRHGRHAEGAYRSVPYGAYHWLRREMT